MRNPGAPVGALVFATPFFGSDRFAAALFGGDFFGLGARGM
jgi:hypothetical protein